MRWVVETGCEMGGCECMTLSARCVCVWCRVTYETECEWIMTSARCCACMDPGLSMPFTARERGLWIPQEEVLSRDALCTQQSLPAWQPSGELGLWCPSRFLDCSRVWVSLCACRAAAASQHFLAPNSCALPSFVTTLSLQSYPYLPWNKPH